MPEKKIFLVPYAVDNDQFMKAAELGADEKAEIRRRYNLPADRPVALYAAKFMHRKRPLDLLDAARRLNSRAKLRSP